MTDEFRRSHDGTRFWGGWGPSVTDEFRRSRDGAHCWGGWGPSVTDEVRRSPDGAQFGTISDGALGEDRRQ